MNNTTALYMYETKPCGKSYSDLLLDNLPGLSPYRTRGSRHLPAAASMYLVLQEPNRFLLLFSPLWWQELWVHYRKGQLGG